ncbi:hypothetical protein CDAR_320792 [Caerostris darwini]|uniref:Uncharacterized protein n=1 Tax=Caerostris darwini TaxID=1538125 RepID=A0AAV4X0U1_9ARAC|nr:hypothetical protein CDAR_320792 [Caerostris darwini]
MSQIITLPVASTPTTIAMSPFKVEPAILPKTVHLPSSPVILSTPQRVVANVINNTRTPQQLLPAPEHSISGWSAKRPREFAEEYPESKRCKKGEKGGKGLRHFSMKVCEKVRKKELPLIMKWPMSWSQSFLILIGICVRQTRHMIRKTYEEEFMMP